MAICVVFTVLKMLIKFEEQILRKATSRQGCLAPIWLGVLAQVHPSHPISHFLLLDEHNTIHTTRIVTISLRHYPFRTLAFGALLQWVARCSPKTTGFIRAHSLFLLTSKSILFPQRSLVFCLFILVPVFNLLFLHLLLGWRCFCVKSDQAELVVLYIFY